MENSVELILRIILNLNFVWLGVLWIKNIWKRNKAKKEQKDKDEISNLSTDIFWNGFGLILTLIFLGVGGLTQSFKPVIYLYPEQEIDVSVKVGSPEKLTCTYPKYKEGWEVTAKPNGDLIDKETGRSFYSLYWEGKNEVKHDITEGFIVEGKDAEKFLEEKLEILGLNEREAQEFIIYWLPELEKNKYNFIRFETMEQINEDMPLEIIPKPDTIIRIMMVSKKVLMPYEVKEQKLEKVERKGFTVVEWGGTRI